MKKAKETVMVVFIVILIAAQIYTLFELRALKEHTNNLREDSKYLTARDYMIEVRQELMDFENGNSGFIPMASKEGAILLLLENMSLSCKLLGEMESKTLISTDLRGSLGRFRKYIQSEYEIHLPHYSKYYSGFFFDTERCIKDWLEIIQNTPVKD